MAVFLSPVGGVAAQFFTNNGVPLSGGKLYTYAAGTTTPAATYTSSSGGTAHANPIVLDSGGRVPSGEIWLTDGTSYKFLLKDSNDVLIATYDNIVGINSNFVNFFAEEEVQVATAGQTVFTLVNPYVPGGNTLSVFVDGVNQYNGSTYSYVETSASTVTFYSGLHVGALVKFTTVQSLTSGQQTDAALVTYNEGDTGAVTYTVRAKLQQTVSVKDFGAVGNGTTNDTVAIQAALDTGKTVYIPKGTYLISLALQLKTTNQLVYGDGQQSILLTATDIETMYSSTSVFGVVLSDLQFKNTVSEILTGPTHFHVHFGTGASGCVIRNCGFNTALTGSYVRTTHHAGVWFEGANLNSILDCTFGQAQILMGSTDSTIRGGYVYAFSFQYAIKITSAGEVLVEGIRGILGGPSQGCIWIPVAGYMNKIVNNYFGGSYSYINIGNGVTGLQQQALNISGNTFHEVDGIGIYLVDSAGGASITSNSFFAGNPKQNDPTFATPGNQDILIESTAYPSTGVVIADNTFNRFNGPIEDGMPGIGKSYSIQFSGAYTAVNNVVSDNTFTQTTRYYSPAIAGIQPQNTKIGNIGVGAELSNQIVGDLNLGASGKFVNVSNTAEVAPAGNITLSINSAAGFIGLLSVGNVLTGTSGFSTKTVFGVSSTGAALVTTSLATQNGATSGRSFTVTQPSAGVLRITDTSGSAANLQLTASFSGMATFAG